jgi:23S rRNA (adenine2503-C2)-methyltransferase
LNSPELIFDYSLHELKQILTSWGEPEYRARQVWNWIYSQLATSPFESTTLPKTLQQQLDQSFLFQSLTAEASSASADAQTRKILFRLLDGYAIETVLMHYHRGNTACISTQAGCAMGCQFCATGQMGFQRNLSSGEIIEQVLYCARQLAEQDQKLTNVVLMGMGEPFHNYEGTIQAIKRLNDSQGFNFGARRFTISTVGLVPMIKQFSKENLQVNLAVSLHAATDELRDQLLPINRRFPLDALIPACREYVEQMGRRITFEWALIENVNDNPQQAKAFVERVGDLNCHVNLIPLNPTRGYTGKSTPRRSAEGFQSILRNHRISCTIRTRRGLDIQAGCGQLATEHQTHSAA